jgi:tartrate-resistant acid phosphatase type 5
MHPERIRRRTMVTFRGLARVLLPLALVLPMVASLAAVPVDAPPVVGVLAPPLRVSVDRDPQAAEGVQSPPTRFVAWGDGGMGNERQAQTVDAAVAVCARKGCDFALHLGDNVYEVGVESPRDPQFDEKFESPYANWTLPVYLVLGNHDVGIRYENGRDNGDHQVAYALREDRFSDKWRMPQRAYAFEHGDALFVALDLTAHARHVKPFETDAQLEWLEETLGDSDARWRVVFSHFPYVSNGRHGDAGSYDGREGRGAPAKAFLEAGVCGKAHLYLSAHDHVLQWLEPSPGCGATELIVSGAMAEPRDLATDRNPARFEVGGVTGFFWIELEGDTMRAEAYSSSGELLYGSEVARPRLQPVDQPRG